MSEGLVKPVNLLLSGYSFLRSLTSKNPSISGMPLALGAELTNNCNLKCPECASGSGIMKRARGFMDINLYNRIIEELHLYLININLYFQGEPMMHPNFAAFIGQSKNVNTVLSTNGQFLSEGNAEKLARSSLSKLIISLDGTDQESYSAYRAGGSLSSVLDGIKNISEAKRRYKSSLKVELQFLVNRINEHQIPQIKKLAAAMNSSLKLKSMQILHREDTELWLPKDEKYRRYRIINGENIIKNSMPDRCARLWFNPVVTWDGKVLPCCFDKDADHIMGDLTQESFREIWNGPKYRLFRRALLADRNSIEICRNCTSGMRGVN
jgi:radical SAM protein with 4Fe4S-binding SPASM domain